MRLARHSIQEKGACCLTGTRGLRRQRRECRSRIYDTPCFIKQLPEKRTSRGFAYVSPRPLGHTTVDGGERLGNQGSKKRGRRT